MFLPQIVIHSPSNGFLGLRCESEQLILETIGGLRLVRPIHHPIVDAESVAQRNTSAHTHVIERQKTEPKRPRIIYLILGVISLDPQRAPPLAKVNSHTLSDGKDVSAVSLKNVAIDLRSWFIQGIPLQRVGSLAKLQIQAATPAAPSGRVCGPFEHQASLI